MKSFPRGERYAVPSLDPAGNAEQGRSLGAQPSDLLPTPLSHAKVHSAHSTYLPMNHQSIWMQTIICSACPFVDFNLGRFGFTKQMWFPNNLNFHRTQKPKSHSLMSFDCFNTISIHFVQAIPKITINPKLSKQTFQPKSNSTQTHYIILPKTNALWYHSPSLVHTWRAQMSPCHTVPSRADSSLVEPPRPSRPSRALSRGPSRADSVTKSGA